MKIGGKSAVVVGGIDAPGRLKSDRDKKFGTIVQVNIKYATIDGDGLLM